MSYRRDQLVSPPPTKPDYFGAPMRRAGETWVYFHLAADGLVLYIGKTRSPIERMRSHQANAAWYPEIDRVIWFGPMDEVNATAAERELISVEQPPCNIRHTDRDRYDITVPANQLANAQRRVDRLTQHLKVAKRALADLRKQLEQAS